MASLALALKHSPKIRPVMTRHEQAVSFMACGYAMYTNRLGVCPATVGPGAFNCSPAWRWRCRIPIRYWPSPDTSI
ncbi:thiamine pyrophosphate-binding protein [Streptomyces sp. NPDC006184]|uniref:thiamine pyrophosphate-binding protein n=1 Tax=Streptomyces sp. NPDC006184 TaxID=3155455 RepID=UPI0033AACBB4